MPEQQTTASRPRLQISAAALKWLNDILRERIHPRISLRIDANRFALSIPGSVGRIFITPNPEMFVTGQRGLPCGLWDPADDRWHLPLSGPLPAPGQEPADSILVTRTGNNYEISYDIIGLAYWMLSRSEEIDCPLLDQHERFPVSASHAFKHDYLEQPIVDEWMDILKQAARRLWPRLPQPAPSFEIRVSHDVDWPSRYGFGSPLQMIRLAGADFIKRGQVASLLAPAIWLRTHKKLHRADPFNTFDWLMRLSERNDLHSAFYFICGNTDPARDTWYKPEDTAIRALMRDIHARGHEIGLHASYNTFRTPERLVEEARRLRQVCEQERIHQDQWGGRMHYLRWETPTTLHGWVRAGMDYDSTLTYPDAAGFRCGTCFSYPAFDARLQQQLPLRIRPLIAMEQAVIGINHQGLGISQVALNKFLHLKGACRAVGGHFTLLWHNSQLDSGPKRNLYSAILLES